MSVSRYLDRGAWQEYDGTYACFEGSPHAAISFKGAFSSTHVLFSGSLGGARNGLLTEGSSKRTSLDLFPGA